MQLGTAGAFVWGLLQACVTTVLTLAWSRNRRQMHKGTEQEQYVICYK